MARKRAAGEYTGGRPPYGWTVGPDGVTLEPVSEEQAAIAMARDLSSKGLSLRKIGAILESHGFLPRCAQRWHAETVKKAIVQWHAKTVRDLLEARAPLP